MDDIVMTRSARHRQNIRDDFSTVTYTAPKKKPKTTNTMISPEQSSVNKKSTTEEQNREQQKVMKRLRYDVIKFGISGLTASVKDEAKVALAIQLGAKPVKKRKAENYKILQMKRKKQKEKAKLSEAKDLHARLTRKTPKSNKRKKRDGILDVYGRVDKRSTK